MEKLPVNFGEGIAPHCPVCHSGEYMRNEDGNENNFCGQCGTALDWDNMYNIDSEEIIRTTIKRCKECKNFTPINNPAYRSLRGSCKIKATGRIRREMQKACRKFDSRLKEL